jgi:branched-chain amino acid transport system permease protein
MTIKRLLNSKTFWYASLAIALLLLPLSRVDQLLHIMIMVFMYAYLGSCWNILGGFAGQFSIGHAVFFGAGAYTSSLLLVHYNISPWLGMLVGGVVAAIIGLGFGFAAFRFGLKGHFFALATIAFCKVVEIIVLNLEPLGAAVGVLIPPREPSLSMFQFETKLPFYYIIFGLMLLSILVVFLINQSKLGLYLSAVRDDEAAAESLGINLLKYKIYAIVLSAFFTALGGTFFAQYLTYIQPSFVLSVGMSIEIIVRPIIGGMGTIMGPILGAFILDPIAELSRNFLGGYAGVHLAAYGVILVICCLFFPDGLINEIPFLKRVFGMQIYELAEDRKNI